MRGVGCTVCVRCGKDARACVCVCVRACVRKRVYVCVCMHARVLWVWPGDMSVAALVAVQEVCTQAGERVHKRGSVCAWPARGEGGKSACGGGRGRHQECSVHDCRMPRQLWSRGQARAHSALRSSLGSVSFTAKSVAAVCMEAQQPRSPACPMADAPPVARNSYSWVGSCFFWRMMRVASKNANSSLSFSNRDLRPHGQQAHVHASLAIPPTTGDIAFRQSRPHQCQQEEQICRAAAELEHLTR